MKVLLVACGAAHLPQIARALEKRDSLAGMWVSNKNSTKVSKEKYRRSWIFHLTMKPFYHLLPGRFIERLFHLCFPIWRFWVRRQKLPQSDVIHAIMGYGTEPFDLAENTSILRVIDASSSHPTSFFGFWRREVDIWSPNAKIGIPQWLFSRCNRELERADLILCPSTFVRDSMIYNGISAEKCVVNPYGVDISIFTPREQLPSRPRFVCVGSICLRKGHPYLFRAFQKVRATIPDAELICVGSFYPDFEEERKRWDGTFTHYQNLSHPELAKVLRGCTAFVFPSNEEGFARAIIEAMAAGLPIIATHESGATTLVENGVQGIIVPARQIDKMTDAMIKLATDCGLNEKMGQAAYQRGAKNNSWDDYAERALKIYGETIKKKSQHSQTK
jgi:glycosyltransferase involved in cell wall biosynthesis